MQAIITKYLPCTNHRGSRIKASCDRGSITIDWPHEGPEESHVAAAQALVDKFAAEDAAKYGEHVNPWSRPRACGSIPSGEYVHVFVLSNDTKEALVNLVKLCDAHRWKANADEKDAITEAKDALC